MKYKSYNINNFHKIPYLSDFSPQEIEEMKVVANVLPFKSNNYVVDRLIDWNNVPDDPIYRLTFPHRDMLQPNHFLKMRDVLREDAGRDVIRETANGIRMELNPHPANQKKNVPVVDGDTIFGIQRKYRETVLFFPKHASTCHAYCTFCFRWPQFVLNDEKFAAQQSERLVEYLQYHPEVNNILITGGDPMIMSPRLLSKYLEPIIEGNLPNIHTIRIGSKSLAYWPYKYLDEDVLDIMKNVVDNGFNLAFMAHFNHPKELDTDIVRIATRNIQETGTVIRTQSPVIRHINDDAEVWRQMWERQTRMGMIPYYMFVIRNTGAQHYFAVTLENAYKIFTKAYRSISGVARTMRGPSMSASPGKIEVTGITEVFGGKVFSLRFIQGRDPSWVNKPFFAKFDPDAIWLDDLRPALGSKWPHTENNQEELEYEFPLLEKEIEITVN